MARRRPPLFPTPEELLAPQSPEVRETVGRLRAIVREVVPEAEESVSLGFRLPAAPFPSWQMISYRLGRRPLGFIAWFRDEVRFGVDSGTPLVGPGMSPTGDHQAWLSTFRRPEEVRPESLVPLVREAAWVVSEPRRRPE